MDDNLKQQKITMWTQKLEQLKKDLVDAQKRKGDAASEGDLSENAAYKMAVEDIDMVNARIADVEKILTDLGVDLSAMASAAAINAAKGQ